jgi:hypothetical protein
MTALVGSTYTIGRPVQQQNRKPLQIYFCASSGMSRASRQPLACAMLRWISR